MAMEGDDVGVRVTLDFEEAIFGCKKEKDKPVALYCRSGNRSKTAARILADKGYEVVELGTGFRGWVAAGKNVVKP